MALDFDKHAQEGNEFLNHLSRELGHPSETQKTSIIFRAVLHTLRDRLTVSESINLMAQLPMMLKAVYVDDWKYSDKPVKLKSIEDLKEHVKQEQEKYGETEFSWEESTRTIIETVLRVLSERYLSDGELKNIMAQLPEEMEDVVRSNMNHQGS
ncbi:MAG TPA: DUF2267 domain-containing protein [Bacteroidales bacterium]|nr:DUF2267 domain-containing protein [Bacteroidales bacterium]